MAVFSRNDLKKWREEQKISAADLAERISCDSTTIYRYENGKHKPDPDVMYEICEALGDIDVWTTWMRTEYPRSYARMHPETIQYDLPGSIMSMFAEISDVLAIQNEILRDGADGLISDEDFARVICKEVSEVIQSAQRVKNLVVSRTKKLNDRR